MGSYSIIGVIISLCLAILFLIELIFFFSYFAKPKFSKIILHILGLITSGLVTFYSIITTLKINITIKNLELITLICAILFFILLSINTLIICPKENVKKISKRHGNEKASAN